MDNPDGLFVMPFQELYLLDYLQSALTVCQWRVTKLEVTKSFYCHFPFMNAHEL